MGIVMGAYPPSGIPESGIYNIVYKYIIFQYNSFLNTQSGTHLWYVIAAFGVVYGLMEGEIVKKFFEKKAFVCLGDRSLYLYLVHTPVIFSVTAYIFVKAYQKLGTYMSPIVISYVFTILVCGILIEVLKYITEKYLYPISDRFIKALLIKQERSI